MRVVLTLGLLLVLAGWGSFALPGAEEEGEKAGASGALLSHDVYFTLKDNSAAAKDKLVAACKKYLAKHPGEVAFAVGTRVEDLKREVNDQDFDVALHIVFKTRADHDRYQDADRHKQFIAEHRDNWKRVRVFDSYVQH
jgi:hypothetical protein